VPVGEAGSIRLRGKIDRVDRTCSAALVVTDYKTGGTSRFDDIDAHRPFGDGTKLQLPLYALAARAMLDEPEARVTVSYWFTSMKGSFKDIRYEVTPSILDELSDVLGVALDGIVSGRFPLRPEPPVWRPYVGCAYCDPDGLGTTERFRRWEHVRRDPQLRPYLRLVEPDVADDLDRAAGAEAPAPLVDRGEVER
jgi:ATP-dependent helicase/nuclease subunit B